MASLIARCKYAGCPNYVMPVTNEHAEPRGLCEKHWKLADARKRMKEREKRNKRAKSS